MPHRVCPWWFGYFLASRIRRWLQDPGQIVAPFISEGMTVLEPGPGMGFFTLELARRVGPAGRVIAIDVQPRMLQGLLRRAARAGLSGRIIARPPQGEGLGVDDCAGQVDFALVYAMLHEVPNPAALLADLHKALKPGAKALLVEPAGHVTTETFEASLRLAQAAGLTLESRPTFRRSHAAVLTRP